MAVIINFVFSGRQRTPRGSPEFFNASSC